MRTIIFRLGIGAFCVLGMAVMVLAAVPLPYEYSPSNAVDWTTQSGWSGNVTNSTAEGYALFDAADSTLTLALDGAPTELSFSLRGIPTPEGVAPASFVVEESVVFGAPACPRRCAGDRSARTSPWPPTSRPPRTGSTNSTPASTTVAPSWTVSASAWPNRWAFSAGAKAPRQ